MLKVPLAVFYRGLLFLTIYVNRKNILDDYQYSLILLKISTLYMDDGNDDDDASTQLETSPRAQRDTTIKFIAIHVIKIQNSGGC